MIIAHGLLIIAKAYVNFTQFLYSDQSYIVFFVFECVTNFFINWMIVILRDFYKIIKTIKLSEV